MTIFERKFIKKLSNAGVSLTVFKNHKWISYWREDNGKPWTMKGKTGLEIVLEGPEWQRICFPKRGVIHYSRDILGDNELSKDFMNMDKAISFIKSDYERALKEKGLWP